MSRITFTVIGLVIGAILGAALFDNGPGLEALVVLTAVAGAGAGLAIGSRTGTAERRSRGAQQPSGRAKQPSRPRDLDR